MAIQRTQSDVKYARDSKLFDRLGDYVLTSSKNLEAILCSFHLQRGSLLKKILFLLLSRIPIAFNRVLISSLVANDTSLASKKEIFASLSRGIFDQLAAILVRKDCSYGGAEIEWSTIVGKKHMITDGRLLSIGTSQLAAAGEASKEAPSVLSLAIPHEKVWCWSFDLVFKSYENLFRESKMILEEEFSNFRTVNCQKTYLLSRVRDFTDPVEAMRYILGSASRGDENDDLPLAVGLPMSAKMSLSSCLESFFLLQDRALQNIFCSETCNTLHSVECACVVSSWLLCQEEDGYSIDGAASAWRDAEERYEVDSSSRDGAPHQTKNTLSRSHKKMLSRLDSLISTIGGLLKKSGQQDGKGVLDLSQNKSYAAAESLVRVLEPDISLRARLEAKVRAWDMIASERGDRDERPIKVPKRRKFERSSTKRTTVRNRTVGHRVVSEWLLMDGNDGARVSRKDSFADLDDFLVEN